MADAPHSYALPARACGLNSRPRQKSSRPRSPLAEPLDPDAEETKSREELEMDATQEDLGNDDGASTAPTPPSPASEIQEYSSTVKETFRPSQSASTAESSAPAPSVIQAFRDST